jgi:hypothetical protein
MAARKKALHPLRVEEMRNKIRSNLLVNRLEDHVLAKITDKDLADKAMTDSQVRAALGLLAKVLPNMSEIKADLEHSGEVAFTWLK